MQETQTMLFKQRLSNLKDQIRIIKEVKSEKAKITNENEFVILQKAKIRMQILSEATKPLPSYQFITNLPQINRERELACIVKHILPRNMRPSFMSSGTLASQIRVTKSIKR